jgi:hypothetical protein
MSKKLLLMRDIVCIYHPWFRKSASRRADGLKCPDRFNVEFLVEESLAAVGPYTFVDGEHYDYSDFSDCKTASIRVNPATPGRNTHSGEISGVKTAGGGQKAGPLRCTIYNPHKPGGELKFYFLPLHFWSNYIVTHPSSGIGKIVYSYNRIRDDIIKFQGYECANFEELAKAS